MISLSVTKNKPVPTITFASALVTFVHRGSGVGNITGVKNELRHKDLD